MRIPWNKGKKGLQVAWNKGKPRNPIFSLKQSNSMKKRYAEGMTVWNKGLKGIHVSPKSEFKKGFTPWNKGKKDIYSQEYIAKLQKSHSGKFGEKSSNWQGGISFEPYPLGWNKTFKEQIRYRDRYKCQFCGKPETECYRKLDVHHIDYDKKNLSIENLISLCSSCHMKTNGNRKYWQDYFMKKEVQIVRFWCNHSPFSS